MIFQKGRVQWSIYSVWLIEWKRYHIIENPRKSTFIRKSEISWFTWRKIKTKNKFSLFTNPWFSHFILFYSGTWVERRQYARSRKLHFHTSNMIFSWYRHIEKGSHTNRISSYFLLQLFLSFSQKIVGKSPINSLKN
jgi:hypothetical protein